MDLHGVSMEIDNVILDLEAVDHIVFELCAESCPRRELFENEEKYQKALDLSAGLERAVKRALDSAKTALASASKAVFKAATEG